MVVAANSVNKDVENRIVEALVVEPIWDGTELADIKVHIGTNLFKLFLVWVRVSIGNVFLANFCVNARNDGVDEIDEKLYSINDKNKLQEIEEIHDNRVVSVDEDIVYDENLWVVQQIQKVFVEIAIWDHVNT